VDNKDFSIVLQPEDYKLEYEKNGEILCSSNIVPDDVIDHKITLG
jgi:hypothetical protein